MRSIPKRQKLRSVESPRNRSDQAVLGKYRLLSGIHQKETSGTVGILRLALVETGLSEKRRLLVTRSSRNRDRIS